MKKFILLLVALLCSTAAYSAEKKIFFDRFEFPLVRTTWIKFEPTTEAWSKEIKLPAAGIRWRIRYIGDKSAFKTLTVTNTQNKTVFSDSNCKKATWINFTGNDTYTLKATGNPHTKDAHIALDTYDNEDEKTPAWRSILMPSWRFLRVKTAPAPKGGVVITPLDKLPRIYTLLSNLTKKYRAEFNVTSAEAQKISVIAAWRNPKGKGRVRVVKNFTAEPGKMLKLPVEFEPKATPVDITLAIEKELTAHTFDVYEIK